MTAFSKFLHIEIPESVTCGQDGRSPAFEITFMTDAEIPFPQVILHAMGGARLIKGEAIARKRRSTRGVPYVVGVPAGLLPPGQVRVQVEGCVVPDIDRAGGGDWIKEFRDLTIHAAVRPRPRVRAGEVAVKLYFGIHKHMHQPFYNASDPLHWDGEKDQIFGSRGGNYTGFVPAAVARYRDGGLPRGGLSTSWSGSLIEQLDRCARDGLCGGRFAGWTRDLRAMAGEQTAGGHPRQAFTAFGYYHPLMPLIPPRDIVKQIDWHREVIRQAFGVAPTNHLFPPETAFHVRMIPALLDAGIESVIYDSIHRFRTCRDYPYGGIQEGMLPPNPAEQVNPAVDDWLQLHNVWAGSRISPALLKPEFIRYEDPDGREYRIVGVPAERYIGNEDARGGFGALQYPDVLGQVYDSLQSSGRYDPRHPPFFLLHSDGDNHGGGADSYYHHNTERLVEWLHEDPRFELTGIGDYLDRFPPDPESAVHVEPGSWAGADNGDPQFMKWFSRYDDPYSPDLNSWAVLTAFQNMVHSLEDAAPDTPGLDAATRLMLTAETSCYWYWTGQDVWDRQVTDAANLAYRSLKSAVDSLVSAGRDRTGPTVFPPWVTPENPGGKRWGQGCLVDAPREGIVHVFVHDVSGLERVDLVLRGAFGEKTVHMTDHGRYPSRAGARVSANYLTAPLPEGAGDLRYHIEAEDGAGNVTRGALERVFVA